MKLLWAECCGELVVPAGEANKPRWCRCGRCAVWWRDPFRGLLSVYGKDKYVSVIGLHNGLLQAQFPHGGTYGCIQTTQIEELLASTPSNYLFRMVGSLVIRVRPGLPGASNDVLLVKSRDDVPKEDLVDGLRTTLSTCSPEELQSLREAIEAVEKARSEPERVRLTEDFVDPPTGMGYPKGTVLIRSKWSGQYMLEGTAFGAECVAGYFLIRDICELVEGAAPPA